MSDNRQFLTDLFSGPFRGHAFWIDADRLEGHDWSRGDTAVGPITLKELVPLLERQYVMRAEWQEILQDDSVPYAKLHSGTENLAAAFGCPVHLYEDNIPIAMPLVETAEEADKIKIPSLDAEPIARIFEAGQMLRERLGPDAIIGVPDVQSPFDIAALIWKKELFFYALYDEPDAVMRLVEKCHIFLKSFITEFKKEIGNCNLCHCPLAWAPPELGMWLSEDESGSLNNAMFEKFCLPTLIDLSETFGGLFMHCCATADHQYGEFKKIPNLRGLNRVFQEPGPRPAIEAFSDTTVLLQWGGEEDVNYYLDQALPNTRFLFNLPGMPIDDAKALLERLRERCPRTD